MRFRLTVTAVREYEVDPRDYLEAGKECITDDSNIMTELLHELPEEIVLDHPDTEWEIQVEQV